MAQTSIPLPLLVGSSEVLSGITERLPLKAAVRLGRMTKALDEWMTPYRERQQEILQKHLNDGETQMTSEHPNWREFIMETNAMMSEEAEIDVEPLSVADLESADVKLSAAGARLLFEAGLLTE